MRRTPLRKANPEYAKELRKYYTKTLPEWLAEHPGCQFLLKEGVFCNQDWGVLAHHKMRRKRYLNDKRFLLTVCRAHHDWIESHKKEARKLGYILYK